MMRDMIKSWVRKIQSSPLSNSDKISAYKHYLEAKLLYILPVCSFSYEQCVQLDRLLSPLLLNMHGIQRNSNQNIIYMSGEHGSLKIYSVFHLQGMAKLQFFFKHFREQDLECGLSKSFFNTSMIRPYPNMDYTFVAICNNMSCSNT